MMKKDNRGQVLLELLAGVAVFSILISATGCAAIGMIEEQRKEKKKQEAVLVFEMMELYLEDRLSRGEEKINQKGMELADGGTKETKLWFSYYLQDVCSVDGVITKISLGNKGTRLKAIVYESGGYQIEVREGMVYRCEKSS